jgi:hypothetical protein
MLQILVTLGPAATIFAKIVWEAYHVDHNIIANFGVLRSNHNNLCKDHMKHYRVANFGDLGPSCNNLCKDHLGKLIMWTTISSQILVFSGLTTTIFAKIM